MMKKIFLLGVLLLFGCANKSEKVYVKTFESGTTFEKANAQCQYEVNLQSRADDRMQDNGIITSILRANATKESCMNRFGFTLQDKNSNIAINEANKLQEEQNKENKTKHKKTIGA